MYNASDKVVLITGGARGIGAEVVKRFLQENAKHVAVLDVDTTYGIALQNKLNEEHGAGKVKFIECDVSKEDDFFSAIDGVYNENGYIDVFINNAGVINEINSASIRKEIEINYLAVVNGTIKAIELMHKKKGGRGGTVINISSVAALCQKSPTLFVYFGTKSAVLQFSNCIGKEEYYSSTDVRVLTICFGATDTSIFDQFQSFDEDVNAALVQLADYYPKQKPEFAGKELVEVFKRGDSGSTWVINNSQPAKDITGSIQKVFEMLSLHFE